MLMVLSLSNNIAFGVWDGACSDTAAKEKTDKIIAALVAKDFEAFKKSYYNSVNTGLAKFTYDGINKALSADVINASFVEISTERYPGTLCVIYELQGTNKKIDFLFRPKSDPPCKVGQWAVYEGKILGD